MPEKRLTINIDDVGIHPAVDRAFLCLAEGGLADSCSVVSCGRSWREACLGMQDLKGRPPIGCHLTLVEERPALPPEKVPSLVGRETGRFPKNYRRLLGRLSLGALRESELEAELSAQIERLLERGVAVSHLDSHQHVHIHPLLLKITVKLAKKYGIPRIRIPFDPWPVLASFPGIRAAFVTGLNWLSRRSFRIVKDAGLLPKLSVGIVRSGQMSEETLARYLKALKLHDQDVELIMHPNADDGAFNASYPHWRFNGEREFALLSGGAVDRLLSHSGFAQRISHAHLH